MFAAPQSTQILTVPANKFGKDYAIGDVHGHADLLKFILDEKLYEYDRLFLVGDLFDRGHNNEGVIDLLMHDDYKNKIIACRGNHEDMALSSIKALESLAASLKLKNAAEMDSFHDQLSEVVFTNVPTSTLKHHQGQGGSWLRDLYKRELDNGLICLNQDGSISCRPKAESCSKYASAGFVLPRFSLAQIKC